MADMFKTIGSVIFIAAIVLGAYFFRDVLFGIGYH
jgi:hypothetical protein